MPGTGSRSMCPETEGHVKVKMKFCGITKGNLYNLALLNVFVYICHYDLWFGSATFFWNQENQIGYNFQSTDVHNSSDDYL